MAVYFIDLDGTIMEHSTQRLLPGAMEMLEALKANNHTIILTTRRGDREWGESHKTYSREATMRAIRENRVPYDQIIFDLSSPRIVVNDDGAFGFEHVTNAEWTDEETQKLVSRV